MEKQTLIHIGYHKTGTSFLQKRIFDGFADAFHLVDRSKLIKNVKAPPPLRFSSVTLQAYVRDEMTKSRAPITVFSNETLSSSIHYGDHQSKYVADRLAACLPGSKVLIGIREQKSMLKSAYNQFLKAKGSYSIREYLINPRSGNFHFEHLQYHNLIQYYQKLFGRDQVLVLPYEVLQNDPIVYLERLFTFLGVTDLLSTLDFDASEKVNRSLKPIQVQVKRYFNPFISKDFPQTGSTFYAYPAVLLHAALHRLFKFLPTKAIDQRIEKKIEREIARITMGQYAESNEQTARLSGVDLGVLGYEIRQ